jgi:uncharacterized phage infection (PIP) family protein YhgE
MGGVAGKQIGRRDKWSTIIVGTVSALCGLAAFAFLAVVLYSASDLQDYCDQCYRTQDVVAIVAMMLACAGLIGTSVYGTVASLGSTPKRRKRGDTFLKVSLGVWLLVAALVVVSSI